MSVLQTALQKLVEKSDLTFEEAQGALGEAFAGTASPVQLSAFLVALRMKGETVEEIAGAAAAMRAASTKVLLPGAPVVADTCGTGGDKQGSFNISTAAAVVVAAAGVPVAKHGNRSISSQCGSADVLEALGVKIDPGPAVVERCLKEIGLAFFFAPAFHPAMKHAMPVRRELGVRTVFNVLGPLTNPGGANAQLIGVFSSAMVTTLAGALVRLGTTESMVVHGAGHDEITLSGPTLAAYIHRGQVNLKTLTPEDFGLSVVPPGSLAGGDKNTNAQIIRGLFQGERGPARDTVVANAAAALWVAHRAAGKSDLKNLKDAVRRAQEVLDAGAAQKLLDRWVQLSNA